MAVIIGNVDPDAAPAFTPAAAGPWTKYAAAAAAPDQPAPGPWTKYGAAPVAPPSGSRSDADIRSTPEYMADKAQLEQTQQGGQNLSWMLPGGVFANVAKAATGTYDKNGVNPQDYASPLPLGDEVAGVGAAAGALLHNGMNFVTGGDDSKDVRSAYLAGKDAYSEPHDAYAAQHPVLTTAMQAAPAIAALPLLPEMAAPGLKSAAPIAKLGRFAMNAAKGAGAGAAYGAAYGASQADGGIDARIKGALGGAGSGALAGGAGTALLDVGLPMMAKAGSGVGSVLSDIGSLLRTDPNATPALNTAGQTAAQDLFSSAMAKAGINAPADVDAATAARPGPDLTAAELAGRNGIGNVMALSRRGGTTSDAASALYSARRMNTPDAIKSDMASSLGVNPDTAASGVAASVDAGRTAAGPLYDAALRPGGGPSPRIMTPELAELAQRPEVQAAMARAARSARNAGRDPMQLGLAIDPDTGAPMIDPVTQQPSTEFAPTAETWDAIQKDIGSSVMRDPHTSAPITRVQPGVTSNDVARNRDLLTLANDMGSAQRAAMPGIGEARDAAGDYMGEAAMFARASGSLTRGTASDFGKLWASAKTPAQQNAVKAAMANDALNMFNSGQLRGGKFSVPNVQQKLELAFGRDGAQQFIAQAQNRAQALTDASRMAPGLNSPTAEAAQFAKEQDGSTGGDAQGFVEGAAKALKYGPIRSIYEATSNGLLKALSYSKSAGMPVPVRDELGRLYLMDADQLKQFLTDRAANAAALPRVAPIGRLPPTVTGAVTGGAATQASQ